MPNKLVLKFDVVKSIVSKIWQLKKCILYTVCILTCLDSFDNLYTTRIKVE